MTKDCQTAMKGWTALGQEAGQGEEQRTDHVPHPDPLQHHVDHHLGGKSCRRDWSKTLEGSK